jgi:hypothetical protein
MECPKISQKLTGISWNVSYYGDVGIVGKYLKLVKYQKLVNYPKLGKYPKLGSKVLPIT